MTGRTAILTLGAEATYWQYDDLFQLRLQTAGSRKVSIWLGSCAQSLLNHFQLTEVIPAANSITIKSKDYVTWSEVLSFISFYNADEDLTPPAVHHLQVIYHPRWGDTPEVCNLTGVTFDELVAVHSNCEYYISGFGFLPGFVYLAGGSDQLNLPRKSKPASGVEAGSVAIAAGYTGIYPVHSPGGWYCIGKTDAKGFDVATGQFNSWKIGDIIILEPKITYE